MLHGFCLFAVSQSILTAMEVRTVTLKPADVLSLPVDSFLYAALGDSEKTHHSVLISG